MKSLPFPALGPAISGWTAFVLSPGAQALVGDTPHVTWDVCTFHRHTQGCDVTPVACTFCQVHNVHGRVHLPSFQPPLGRTWG